MPQQTGLTEQQALALLKAEGPNELPQGVKRSFLVITAEVLREPMFALLLLAGAVYFVIGSLHEAAMLMLFSIFSISIAIIQGVHSENVLRALRDLTSPRALVLRDGQQKRIAGRDIVRVDVILLNEGDRVPADGCLVTGHDLMVDESLLTGESAPIMKGDDQPRIFSGTLVVRGGGRAMVTATGAHSEIGKIGHALGSIQPEAPRLQKQIRKIIHVFGTFCLIFSVLATVMYGMMRGIWHDAFLGGIALGMSLLPQEFPLVLTSFMVMGAWRISKVRVLTRRAAAIESLGAATVLCTDKTGTLTVNRMSVIMADENCLEAALLASKTDTLDPMDIAVADYARSKGVSASVGTLIHQYGLRPDLLAMTHIWRTPDGKTRIAAKGAPEAIADLCRIDKEALLRRVGEFAHKGIRVLGVAECRPEGPEEPLPDTPRDFHFKLLGLIGFIDPLRAEVPQAVSECRAAGIRVVMITGDYPETARAIAAQAGILSGEMLTGGEVAALDEAALQKHCKTVTVFARIMPDQKLRIVQALKANGDIVAMTGDGVNDAPALKAAHIGIAMGGRGTDVAREASSIVLLDDDFGSIVHTIRLGRRIYDNLRKAMIYIIAVHGPIAGISFLPLFFDFPLILTPMLIALMEMVIDPTCAIILEAEEEEKNVMARPPRHPNSHILSPAAWGWGLFQGVTALAVVAGIFYASWKKFMPEDEIRALAFISLMTCNLALIFVNRSYSASLLTAFGRRNPTLWGGIFLVLVALTGLFNFSPARELFRFAPVHPHDLLISCGAGVFLLILLESIKSLWWQHPLSPKR